MRSSDPPTTMIDGISTMYGHTFITNGHDGVICAYNAQDAKPPLSAPQMPPLQPILGLIMPNTARITSILLHHASLAGQKRG
uniref:Uncharacterized protein n=1 Tax=uncultured prokaryote TaxID=198431 RepID=A0A0H5Q6W2_9ZZZZ|nr:hypothetical protein [uncultured prokaryote]